MNLMSLFDGIGCFPIAWANINNIKYENLSYYSSEIEDFLISILNSNLPKSIQLNDVKKISDLDNLKADIITMGTPCPGFSISGKREGLEHEETELFNIGVDVIRKVKPKYFVWENVFGVFSANEGKEFRTILDEFKKIGYDVVWTILDTQFFNLPQGRRRVYMIGVRDGIPFNHNIFEFFERSSSKLKKEIQESKDNRKWDFNPESKNPIDHYAFFNRQRSDLFKERGLSCTLAKRDYKSFMDLVVKNGTIRKITPKERLRLQGIPDYWFDCTSNVKSDKERYRANGMSVNVVEYVFKQLLKISKNQHLYEMANSSLEELILSDKTTIYFSDSAQNIHKDIKVIKKTNEEKVIYKNIPSSGHIRLKRDSNGNIISNEAEYLLIDNVAESKPNIEIKDIKDILLDKVDKKYNISIGGCEGILKRELKSGNLLPKKLKEVIFYQYPELELKYNKK